MPCEKRRIKIDKAQPSKEMCIERNMWKSDGAKVALQTGCGINAIESSSRIFFCAVMCCLAEGVYALRVFNGQSGMHLVQLG